MGFSGRAGATVVLVILGWAAASAQEGDPQAELRVAEAEKKLAEAEKKAADAERNLAEAEKRLAEAERKAGLPPKAQDSKTDQAPQDPPEKPGLLALVRKWYEVLNLRGYTQIRHSNLPSFDRNDDLINDQGDKSIGGGGGVFVRRARLIIAGDVHPQVSVYLQPDFASSIGEQNHVTILRDWYFDLFLDPAREFRLRIGQSKVPFGFVNLQSSSNRLPLDRDDAINSAVKDERDLGVFAYWAPDEIRKRFRDLQNAALKGSGDYGVIGIGAYNGQCANRFDRNGNLHAVGRVAYPFKLWGDQYFETWGGAYYGRFRVTLQNQGGITYTTPDDDNDLLDWRWNGGFCFYPQPFGIQGEWNAGMGPQQGENDVSRIKSRGLRGGYLQAMCRFEDCLWTESIMPYVRYTYYQGGKKFENNAPRYDVREAEFGFEVQVFKALEVTLCYAIADRTSSRFPYEQEEGHLLRLQVQFNY
jgi:hypothetical protein